MSLITAQWMSTPRSWQRALVTDINVDGPPTDAQLRHIRRHLRRQTRLNIGSVFWRPEGGLAPLTLMPALETLWLTVNTTDNLDLTPLTQLPALQELWIRVYGDQHHTPLTLDVIGSIRDLRSLQLSEVPLHALAPLTQLTQLRELRLSYRASLGGLLASAADLSALRPLRKLKHLSISGDLGSLQVTLDDVAQLKQLVDLHLDDTELHPIYTAAQLGRLRQLRYLDLSGTHLCTPSGLTDLPLETLHLPHRLNTEPDPD
ncbi:MAG: hypothetical protein AAFV53_27735 [Myxococcota bacterium]